MKILNPADLAPGELVFTEHDAHGWPRCPQCHARSLESCLQRSGTSLASEPRVYLHILSGMACARCGFELLPGLIVPHMSEV